MKETTFKALMHDGKYVDPTLLWNGIYNSPIPHIYGKDDTIKSLIGRAEMMKDMTGDSFVSKFYFENLKKCQLVDVSLTEIVK